MAEVVLFEDYLGNRLSADATARLKQVLANDSLARSRFVAVLLEAQALSTLDRFLRNIAVTGFREPVEKPPSRGSTVTP